MAAFGFNHFGVTVRDLEASTRFYERLGAKVGPPDGRFSGAHMDHGLGLDGVVLRTRMLSFDGVVVEFCQYDAPEGCAYRSHNNDVGSPHIALQVEDVLSLHRELVADGVEFYSPPQPIDDGPFVGGYWVYFRDPDGISVELIQAGPGTAHRAP